MIAKVNSPLALKRRRLTSTDPMEAESAKAKVAAMKETFGREICVFETTALSQTSNEASTTEEPADDFYEFTAEDYYRLMRTKKEDKYLKTRKLREAEEAARRSRVTKAVIRVRFPDNHTLEATFHPSETIQSLVDLLMKVLARPDLPFYIYTTPPKKQVKDMSLDFFSAGFVPGAIVYFSYDLSKVDDAAAASNSGPFLKEEVMSLKGFDASIQQAEQQVESAPEPEAPGSSPSHIAQDTRAAEKKPAKPKWFKM